MSAAISFVVVIPSLTLTGVNVKLCETLPDNNELVTIVVLLPSSNSQSCEPAEPTTLPVVVAPSTETTISLNVVLFAVSKL